MNLYREVDFEKEPCQFVGVHCLRWHDHPDQPTIGFVEVELKDIPEVKQLKQAFEDQITRIEQLEARGVMPIVLVVEGRGQTQANAQGGFAHDAPGRG